MLRDLTVPLRHHRGRVVLAYCLFSLTLHQDTNIGVAYSIWAALGVSL